MTKVALQGISLCYTAVTITKIPQMTKKFRGADFLFNFQVLYVPPGIMWKPFKDFKARKIYFPK